jgi:hypothetical protein
MSRNNSDHTDVLSLMLLFCFLGMFAGPTVIAHTTDKSFARKVAMWFIIRGIWFVLGGLAYRYFVHH